MWSIIKFKHLSISGLSKMILFIFSSFGVNTCRPSGKLLISPYLLMSFFSSLFIFIFFICNISSVLAYIACHAVHIPDRCIFELFLSIYVFFGSLKTSRLYPVIQGSVLLSSSSPEYIGVFVLPASNTQALFRSACPLLLPGVCILRSSRVRSLLYK